MKLRISIIALGMSLLVNSGCTSFKSAYVGDEHSHFTNPAKIAAMDNAQAGLPPVAAPPEGPVPTTYGAGGTGVGRMTGLSTEPQFPGSDSTADSSAWGGALSTR